MISDKDTPIINCHIHLFTDRNIPRWFPNIIGSIIRRTPWAPGFLRFVAAFLGQEQLAAWATRLISMRDIGRKAGPEEILKDVQKFYPSGTRFIALPMDMKFIGRGHVAEDIGEQHRRLWELSRQEAYADTLIPFATVNPQRPTAFYELQKCIEEYGFKGVKLYPKLGYKPDDPLLMQKVYPYCVKHNIPIMTHCSAGGVRNKAWSQAQADAVSHPKAFFPVLDTFPKLRVCLAHFGGDAAWDQYINEGIDRNNPQARKDNFLTTLLDVMGQQTYKNLWTDISYTAFRLSQNAPFLRVFLENESIRDRVLFGSDFYMSRQEASSERAVSVNLRVVLGEEIFNQISRKNPLIYLGENNS